MSYLPLIISASQLHQAIQDNAEDLCILDVRDKEEYLENHIPTANWFDNKAVNKSHNQTNGLLPDIQTLYAAIKTSGYTNQKHIVIYNANCNPVAGRVAWTLYAFGLDNISLLNGGFDYWNKCNLPIDNKHPSQQNPASTFTIENLRVPDKDIACNAEDIRLALNKTNTVIIDTRTPAEYTGEDVRALYGGHIPGAININWTETKAADGLLFKTEDELHQLFKQHGLKPNSCIITYCQSHQRSALLAILLIHLGYTYTTGYPGAWSDWGNKDDTPKEK